MTNEHQEPRQRTLLEGTRVYLSGPMDFVASRREEMKYGWRTRVGAFLRARGCIVFDPWQKPAVRGLQEYGREGLDTARTRKAWTFEDSRAGAKKRAKLTDEFWETLHIDLRMVDTSDFTIAYCPTNLYSVGTPHEITLCRQQRKPVLFVSPPVDFPKLHDLRNPSHTETRPQSSEASRGSRATGAHQAESERHPESVVHAAGRRRELFRRLWIRGFPSDASLAKRWPTR